MSFFKKLFGSQSSEEQPDREEIDESSIIDITILLGFSNEPSGDYDDLAYDVYEAWNPSWSGSHALQVSTLKGGKDEMIEWIQNDYTSQDIYSSNENIVVFAQVASTENEEQGPFWVALLTAVNSDSERKKILMLNERPLRFKLS